MNEYPIVTLSCSAGGLAGYPFPLVPRLPVREISGAGISLVGSTWSTASSRLVAASGHREIRSRRLVGRDDRAAEVMHRDRARGAVVPPPDKMTIMVHWAVTRAREVSGRSADGR